MLKLCRSVGRPRRLEEKESDVVMRRVSPCTCSRLGGDDQNDARGSTRERAEVVEVSSRGARSLRRTQLSRQWTEVARNAREHPAPAPASHAQAADTPPTATRTPRRTPSTGHERTGPCRPRAAPTGRSQPGVVHPAPRSARCRRKALGPKRPLRGESQGSSRVNGVDRIAVLVRIRRNSVHRDRFRADSPDIVAQ